MAKKKATPKQAKSPAPKQPKYPRHSVEKALRIPKAILDQNAGKPCTPGEAAGYLGLKAVKGPFSVEIGSAKKYGFLDSPEQGKIQTTELGRRVLRPKSSEDQLRAYREAILQAPDFSDVYKHYRGENIPQDNFFMNTLADTFGIPEADYSDFKQVFLESLAAAKLIEKRGESLRVVDVSEETPNLRTEDKSEHLKKLGAAVHVKAGDSCFVMQPFAQPLGSYYEKIFRPAIEKAGLQPVRADAEIFGTGKIIDQIWRGINNAKVLIAELTTRNPNVFYELGIAHALQKPVVLVAANEPDVPFDLKHIRVIYYDVQDPFWGSKLIDKLAENILSAISNPEEAIFKASSES
jgi:hypothetical protein